MSEEKNLDETQVVVMAGNLSDGYQVIGPFKNYDDAIDFAMGEPDMWLMELHAPSGFGKGEDEEAKCGSRKCCEGDCCGDK